jgi:hypothetical protein
VFAIRSERLLCREVQVNLAYRWWNEFLPMSIPITAISALAVLGMGVLLMMKSQSSVSRWQGGSTAGPSH